MSEAVRSTERFTWRDYRSWSDDERWEIIGGEAFAMTPAPILRHQRIVTELNRQMANAFLDKPCSVFVSPTDVKLSEEDVVQPDLLVVCDESKMKRTHIEGVPTLVVEVLSPSTVAFDRVRKLRLYAVSGVQEVWLVTPYPHTVEVFALDGDEYRLAGVYGKEDTLTSRRFSELTIDLDRLFDFPIEPGERIEMVKEGRPPYGRGEGGAGESGDQSSVISDR
jgi:Uma2 family endonuclease